MPHILAVQSSPFAGESVSRMLVDRLISKWQADVPNLKVTQRDVARDPVPHLDVVLWDALKLPEDQLSDAHQQALHLADTIIAEVIAADIIVIGTPMHNFTVPSSLKAWIDHICLPGRTFRYTEEGPKSTLAPGKQLVICAARGGMYGMEPFLSQDHQVPYLSAIFAFLGIETRASIVAEGVAISPDLKDMAIAMALGQVDGLSIA